MPIVKRGIILGFIVLTLQISFALATDENLSSQPAPTPIDSIDPAPSPSPEPIPPEESEPEPAPVPPEIPTHLNPTVYYKPVIYVNLEECPTSDIVDMLSPEGKILVTMCGKDYRNCLMQGACFVFDSTELLKSFNYYARGKDDVPRFKEVDLKKCPYGYGVRNTCLDPYYTVAADLSIYKPGDVIFVPIVVGEILPDGEAHDGFFVIRDRGAAIIGPGRFDFFTGLDSHRTYKNPFIRLGFADRTKSFEFRLATPEEAEAIRIKSRYPGIRKGIVLPPIPPPQQPEQSVPEPAPSPTPELPFSDGE